MMDRKDFNASAALPQHPVYPPGRNRRPLNAALRDSTVAIAIFDDKLRCRVSNAGFASITGAPMEQHPGKTLDEILGAEIPQFRLMLLQVWNSMDALWEQSIEVALPSGPKGRWIVDFFPIPNAVGSVQMVGAAFSESTCRDRIEKCFRRLANRFPPNASNGENRVSAKEHGISATKDGTSAPPEHGELPERYPPEGYVHVMERTVNILNRSMALRRVVSKTRVASSFQSYSLRQAADALGKAFELMGRNQSEDTPDVSPMTPAARAENTEKIENKEKVENHPSPREMEVVRFLADGKSNKEIAGFLNLSTRTVETYRSRLMAKLKVHSAAEIVRYAIRKKLIEA